MKAAQVVSAALCLPLLTLAAEAPWQIESSLTHEHLSNGSPDWRQLDLALRRRLDGGAVVDLGLRQAERYDATDRELGIGATWPVAADWQLALRGTTAGSAAFLPRNGIAFDVSRQLGSGWLANAGMTRNRFAPTDVSATGTTLLRLGLERYFGDWRLASGWTRGRLDGGQAANGWRFQVDHYFGEAGRIGLLVAGGRELEAAPLGLISTRVDSAVLLARWRMAEGWSLTVDAGRTRVSDILRQSDAGTEPLPGGYRRDGVRVGVQHEF
ncbi:MAG: hypothetical protein RLZZ598_223 [Pseudomonadota bacterium]|jgi:YaiO family outer membrane protein